MNNYKYQRMEKGLSQQEVAEEIGCHYNTISKIERDEVKPSLNIAIKLAHLYGVSVEELEGK